MAKFTYDEEVLQNMMDMTPDEVISEFGVDEDKLGELFDAVKAGSYVYGGSPTAYFSTKGLVFDGALMVAETDPKLRTFMLVSMAEAGSTSFKLADKAGVEGHMEPWDKDVADVNFFN